MSTADLIDAAAAALGGTRIRIADAPSVVPPRPGLYAIWGDPSAWDEVGVQPTLPAGPLYVGKSESSLLDREVFTHFNASPTRKPATGSSTVRRSFAALLHDQLHFEVTPRNPARPSRFSHYGLTSDGDARLTAWMAEHLELTVWAPDSAGVHLGEVEIALIARWDPPMNIKDAPPRPRLRQLRKEMAAAAQAWAENRG